MVGVGNTQGYLSKKSRHTHWSEGTDAELANAASEHRTPEDTLQSDAAAAEALLDLSHVSTSSPNSSNCSYKPAFDSPRVPTSGTSGVEYSTYSPQQAPYQLETSDHDVEANEGCETKSHRQPTESSRKRIPTRCKCGKRVSAEHPPCKSELMLLCERFQERFCKLCTSGEPSRIDLNQVTEELGVGRRRLYDINIVFEAAEVLQRTGKLSYVWKGKAQLPELIQQLRSEEEKQEPVCRKSSAVPAGQAQNNRQGDYSMWTLTRKLMRHLLTREGPVSLSEAADHLIGSSVRGPKRAQTQMTVERRLYDIGSILSTLDLIDRVYTDGKRQPSFAWKYNATRTASDTSQPNASTNSDLPSLLGTKMHSAFMRCEPPQEPLTVDNRHLTGLKRKYSDEDTSSGQSAVTDLGMAPSMSLTGPGIGLAPWVENDKITSPTASSSWHGAVFSQGLCMGNGLLQASLTGQLNLQLPTSFPALTLPQNWPPSHSGASMNWGPTLCKPQAIRGPVSLQF